MAFKALFLVCKQLVSIVKSVAKKDLGNILSNYTFLTVSIIQRHTLLLQKSIFAYSCISNNVGRETTSTNLKWGIELLLFAHFSTRLYSFVLNWIHFCTKVLATKDVVFTDGWGCYQ